MGGTKERNGVSRPPVDSGEKGSSKEGRKEGTGSPHHRSTVGRKEAPGKEGRNGVSPPPVDSGGKDGRKERGLPTTGRQWGDFSFGKNICTALLRSHLPACARSGSARSLELSSFARPSAHAGICAFLPNDET